MGSSAQCTATRCSNTEDHTPGANLESSGSKMEQHLHSETSLHLAILASRARGTFYP